jgi:hypothetical protein
MRKDYKYKVDGDISYLYLYQRNGTEHIIILNTYNLQKILSFKYKWSVSYHKCPKAFYARACVYLGMINEKPKYKPIQMHQFLMNVSGRTQIDHKNNNTLDNRIENLRKTNHTGNGRNRETRNSNNTSGKRNVSIIKGKPIVQLMVEGENMTWRDFKSVEEAGQFAELMREKYYGEYKGNN